MIRLRRGSCRRAFSRKPLQPQMRLFEKSVFFISFLFLFIAYIGLSANGTDILVFLHLITHNFVSQTMKAAIWFHSDNLYHLLLPDKEAPEIPPHKSPAVCIYKLPRLLNFLKYKQPTAMHFGHPKISQSSGAFYSENRYP